MFVFPRKLFVAAVCVAAGSLVCLPGASASPSHEAVTAAPTTTEVSQTEQSSHPAVNLRKTNGKYYVNNHEIVLEFNYDSEFYDKTAWYQTHLNIPADPDATIVSAEIGNFNTTWSYSMSKDHVLGVKVVGLNGHVYRASGGAYNDKRASYDVKTTTMMVDPDTGKVFDFLEGNYFYNFGYMKWHFLDRQPVACEGC